MSRRMFLSYAREDLGAVAELAADLQAVGHEVWLDRNLTGGQDWWNTILERIRWCEVFVVGMSDPFLRSVACGRELDYAQALRRVVLPVRGGPVQHEGLVRPELGRWQHVEWSGDKASTLRLLGAVTGLDAAPPLPTPAPPPPPVPLSYLGTLRAEIVGVDTLDFDRQLGIAGRLRAEAQSTHQIPEVRALIALLRERRDLTTYVDRELQRLLDDLGVADAAQPILRAEPARPESPPARDAVPSNARPAPDRSKWSSLSAPGGLCGFSYAAAGGAPRWRSASAGTLMSCTTASSSPLA